MTGFLCLTFPRKEKEEETVQREGTSTARETEKLSLAPWASRRRKELATGQSVAVFPAFFFGVHPLQL